MGNAEEFGLPKKEPLIEALQQTQNKDAPVMLYSTVSLSVDSLQKLLTALRVRDEGLLQEEMNPEVALAPGGTDFEEATLRQVYNAHVELMMMYPETGYWPYFVVNNHKDWETHGVLVVNLEFDNADQNYEVDVLRMPVKDVGSQICNLKIANQSWYDFKGFWEYRLVTPYQLEDQTGEVAQSQGTIRADRANGDIKPNNNTYYL